MSKQTLKNFKDPETKRNHKLATKASWQDPVKYANHVAGFITPEARKNRKASARLGWIGRYLKLKETRLLKALAQAMANVPASNVMVSNSGD